MQTNTESGGEKKDNAAIACFLKLVLNDSVHSLPDSNLSNEMTAGRQDRTQIRQDRAI